MHSKSSHLINWICRHLSIDAGRYLTCASKSSHQSCYRSGGSCNTSRQIANTITGSIVEKKSTLGFLRAFHSTSTASAKTITKRKLATQRQHDNDDDNDDGQQQQHRYQKQLCQQPQQPPRLMFKQFLNRCPITGRVRQQVGQETTTQSSTLQDGELEAGSARTDDDDRTSYAANQESNSSNTLQNKTPLPFDAIPGPKPSLPFLGTSWIYLPYVGHYKSMKLHEANMDKYHRYGPIMKEEYQRGIPTVTIFDPSDIKEVFMRESACPSRPVLPFVIKHRQSDPTRYPNVGLANMEGPEWLELRSRMAPLLLSKDLKERHISTQNRVSSRLVSYIKSLFPAIDSNNSNDSNNKSGIVKNIQEVFYRFSMESIMNSCINQELGCLRVTSGDNFEAESSDGELIFRAAMNFFEAQHKLYYGLGLWKFLDTQPYRQLRDSQDAIHDIASKYIDAALIHLKKKKRRDDKHQHQLEMPSVSSGSTRNGHESLLETLYHTNKFNDLEIKSTIVDFVGGGTYTVANTLTMCLFLLASNPKIQEQLNQEIRQVFKSEEELNDDINIDTEKLEQLKFLKLCLKETHRLLPTIPGVARTLHKDTVLSNYLVPKNTLVFCNFMVTCRLPQYFENPDEFNPSRWERNGKLKNDSAFCLLPFGHGVRKCIGHNFAELEIYIALAKLIRSFKIRTVRDDKEAKSLDLCYKFIVVPEKPVTLEFTPR